jgi:hypothetical protein
MRKITICFVALTARLRSPLRSDDGEATQQDEHTSTHDAAQVHTAAP